MENRVQQQPRSDEVKRTNLKNSSSHKVTTMATKSRVLRRDPQPQPSWSQPLEVALIIFKLCTWGFREKKTWTWSQPKRDIAPEMGEFGYSKTECMTQFSEWTRARMYGSKNWSIDEIDFTFASKLGSKWDQLGNGSLCHSSVSKHRNPYFLKALWQTNKRNLLREWGLKSNAVNHLIANPDPAS